MATKGILRLALIALLFAPFHAVAAETDGFQMLKSLAGDWVGKMEGQPDIAHVSYRVIANGSVVVETMKTDDPKNEMITVFHRDGDKLMATHYCAAGNQPRMKADLKPVDGNKLEFRFVDATNLASPDAGHMRDVTVSIPDSNHLVQEWTFRDKGKDQKAIFRYTRGENNYTSPRPDAPLR